MATRYADWSYEFAALAFVTLRLGSLTWRVHHDHMHHISDSWPVLTCFRTKAVVDLSLVPLADQASVERVLGLAYHGALPGDRLSPEEFLLPPNAALCAARGALATSLMGTANLMEFLSCKPRLKVALLTAADTRLLTSYLLGRYNTSRAYGAGEAAAAVADAALLTACAYHSWGDGGTCAPPCPETWALCLANSPRGVLEAVAEHLGHHHNTNGAQVATDVLHLITRVLPLLPSGTWGAQSSAPLSFTKRPDGTFWARQKTRGGPCAAETPMRVADIILAASTG